MQNAGLFPSSSHRNRNALANFCTAALDQNEQYDDEKYACNYPDDCDVIHAMSPSLIG